MKIYRKKDMAVFVIVAGLLGITAISFGAAPSGVKYGVHNLSTTYPGGNFYSDNETEVCVFCHIPHNASGNKKMLWNRNDSTATFQFYTSSPTLNFTKNIEIGESSMMCLSCHDGGTAISSVINHNITMTFGTSGDEIGDIWDGPGGTIMGIWGPNIGEGYNGTSDQPAGGNLTNDHPISFVYAESSAADNNIKPADGGGNSVGGLPLRNGKVECVTCHDPHINYNTLKPTVDSTRAAYKPFLRKNNGSSSLCFTCHIK